MTPSDVQVAFDGLRSARAIVSALLDDDDETYAMLVRDVAGLDGPQAEAVIGSLAGMLAGQVHLLAEHHGVDPLTMWSEAIARSVAKGV